MRILSSFLITLFAGLGLTTAVAQDMPLVYPVEESCVDCPEPFMPGFEDLPSVPGLPDPFMWSDGRGRIQHYSDWAHRRAEIKAELQHYEIGEKPTDHDSLNASFAGGTLTVDVWRNGKKLTLTSAITLPDGDGPFPLAIGMGGLNLPDSIFANRNIARMNFNFGQVMAHTQDRGFEPINDIYPELKYIGAYSAWPWGVSRLIDGLEIVADEAKIDTDHLAVSGCSFAGKMAIFSGALDERIVLTFGIESGGGGYTTWRYSEVLDRIEAVERLGRTSHAWFIEDMFQFSSDVDKLPLDHHELLAMVAPRALYVTGNPDYVWLADESGYVGSRAAEKVYEALGISDRFGYSQLAGHNHCAVPSAQIPEIRAFVDKFLLGLESGDTDVARTPFSTSLATWIPWEPPTLTEGSSFFGRTSLVAPEDGASGLDTSVDFSWDAYEGARKYYIQLSTGGSFQTVAVEDSTAETQISIDDLAEGKKYFWRIRVRNADGELGPYSDPNSLVTFVQLPAEPAGLTTRINRPSRPNALTFRWGASQSSDSYRLEVAPDDTFGDPLTTATVSDTAYTAVIVGVFEGDVIYWRVAGQNLAGAGPWSQTQRYYILAPPDDLGVSSLTYDQASRTWQVELTWDDNSDIEDGYIIERREISEQIFAVIDTVASDKKQYSDPGLTEEWQVYRVRAFAGDESSDYSESVPTLVIATEGDSDLPTEFSLGQNYPNPFNPATTIRYDLPVASDVRLAVYDALGRQVSTLRTARRAPAGTYEVAWDAAGLPSGLYFVRMAAGDFVATRKMVLMK